VTSSVGWFGALVVFLAHAAASLAVRDDMVQRALCIAMGVTAWAVILPLSLASFLTGVVQALGTAWVSFATIGSGGRDEEDSSAHAIGCGLISRHSGS
jgi:ABC-type anion transport system duplicated permease subunit